MMAEFTPFLTAFAGTKSPALRVAQKHCAAASCDHQPGGENPALSGGECGSEETTFRSSRLVSDHLMIVGYVPHFPTLTLYKTMSRCLLFSRCSFLRVGNSTSFTEESWSKTRRGRTENFWEELGACSENWWVWAEKTDWQRHHLEAAKRNWRSSQIYEDSRELLGLAQLRRHGYVLETHMAADV